VKKLTTGKIWQFAAGQFGWAMLSGIISNWLVYFYQPDKTAISQGQTFHRGWWSLAYLLLLAELQLSEGFLMLLQIQ
jgi:hypothetical protein